jgi:hypothetical protein
VEIQKLKEEMVKMKVSVRTENVAVGVVECEEQVQVKHVAHKRNNIQLNARLNRQFYPWIVSKPTAIRRFATLGE